jgi:hypothetical protein
MPVGTNTELYSGLQQIRGIKTPEPEDVAEAIVEALQTGRVDVYVPKRMNGVIRLGALMPRGLADAIGNVLGSHEAIKHPDHTARAAYEQRIGQTMTAAEPSDPGPEARAAKTPNGQADPDASQSEISSPISTPGG